MTGRFLLSAIVLSSLALAGDRFSALREVVAFQDFVIHSFQDGPVTCYVLEMRHGLNVPPAMSCVRDGRQ